MTGPLRDRDTQSPAGHSAPTLGKYMKISLAVTGKWRGDNEFWDRFNPFTAKFLNYILTLQVSEKLFRFDKIDVNDFKIMFIDVTFYL